MAKPIPASYLDDLEEIGFAVHVGKTADATPRWEISVYAHNLHVVTATNEEFSIAVRTIKAALDAQ